MKHPRLPPLKGHIAQDDWSPPDHPADCTLRRQLADWLALHEQCRRIHCRRAGACRGRTVACFEEQRPLVNGCVYDFILDGYLVDVAAFD